MSEAEKPDLKISHKKRNMYLNAYEEIKKAIITSEFNPGEFLSENVLAAALDMSRTPVREALKKLANEGLVVILPRRGAYVARISGRDIQEIYELRIILECLALKTSLHRITEAEIEELELNWKALLDQVEKGEEVDLSLMSRYDNQLHTLIVDRCDNTRLKYFVRILNMQILRYQFMAHKALGDFASSVRQHLDIIDLLKKRDLEGLTELLKKHLEDSEKIMIRVSST